jgi:hypothetical protein
MLRGLYYPFSRCVDPCTLKQLLLVFDSIAFVDPVDDDEWRAKLFRDLERVADRFSAYRHLNEPIQELRDEGALVLVPPASLKSFDAPATAASTLSDLLDGEWCQVASHPAAFDMPYQMVSGSTRPTWQIFQPKFPALVREALHDSEDLRDHVIWSGDEGQAWTLSYEAGSAVAVNVHVAAAAELGVAPVTDSVLHHRLLIRKLVRSVQAAPKWARYSGAAAATAVAQQTAVDLIRALLPRDALRAASFDSIIKFRESTRDARSAMVAELTSRLTAVVDEGEPANIVAAQHELTQSLSKEVREYQANLKAVRAKLWPSIVQSATGALTAGSAAAVAFHALIGGASGVIAGSIASASLLLLKTTLDLRAESKKTRHSATSSVAYLSRLVEHV